MKVARWGNSLAVRLPRSLVDALGLKEGDDLELSQIGEGQLAIAQDRRRDDSMARLRTIRWAMPGDYVFDREEVYDRAAEAPSSDSSSHG